jgi:hypothetical protein
MRLRHSQALFIIFTWFLFLLSIFAYVSQERVTVVHAAPVSSLSDLIIYSDSLASGWSNWSWYDTTIANFSNTSPTFNNSARSIAVTYASDWAGLSLRHDTHIDASLYQAIAFWVHGGTGSTKYLRVYIQEEDNGSESSYYNFDAPAGMWTPITVTMAALGNPSRIKRINIQDGIGRPQGTVYIDDLRLLAAPPPASFPAAIHIQVGTVFTPFSPYLLGSNLPAWLGPSHLANATFRARTAASGLKWLRLPGGSWSNRYGWLSCERGEDRPGVEPCAEDWENWAAKPSDFIAFLKATNMEGFWVVNPNSTAQEAAALVAFFNGYITDTRPIGTDIRGTQWYTVGHWALLRASKGHTDPVPIRFWEFGNEVYASKASHATPSSAGLCQWWAWEDTWTCDGFEYVNGWESGHTRREGYLEFKRAMQFVDPTIVLAAVGFEYPGTPSDTRDQWQTYAGWGSRVISAAGAALDMYSIHPYPYYDLPPSMSMTLSSPQTFWPSIMSGIRNAFDAYAGGRRAPIAVTEFNLVSVSSKDNNQWMTRAVNMLFLADSIGQAAQNGAEMFAQWDLANGPDRSNGTEYGLMRVNNNYYRAPQYYVYPLWSRFGRYMLPVTSTASPSTELSVYAGWVNSTTVSLLAVNKISRPVTATITISGFGPLTGGVAYEVKATSLGAQSVTYNGRANPPDDLSEPPESFIASGYSVTRVLPSYSVVLLHLYQLPPPVTPKAFVPLVRR